MWFSRIAVSSPDKLVPPLLNPHFEQKNVIASAGSTVWERVTRIFLNFWGAFLDWLRRRLRRWLFDGEVAQHFD